MHALVIDDEPQVRSLWARFWKTTDQSLSFNIAPVSAESALLT